MRLRHLYLALCVLGIIIPHAQFVPWLSQHGVQVSVFARELFATRAVAFFGLDVGVSATVLFVFICGGAKGLPFRTSGCRFLALSLSASPSGYRYLFQCDNAP